MKRLIGEPTFLQNPALQFESLILNKFTVSTELSQWLFVTKIGLDRQQLLPEITNLSSEDPISDWI